MTIKGNKTRHFEIPAIELLHTEIASNMMAPWSLCCGIHYQKSLNLKIINFSEKNKIIRYISDELKSFNYTVYNLAINL